MAPGLARADRQGLGPDRRFPCPKALSRRDFLKSTAAITVGVSAGATMRAGPALAATPIVVRKSGSPRPLTPSFFGLNGNNTQERLKWDRADLGTALTSLSPGVLRYPGGTIGNYWAWAGGWFQPNGPWPGQTNGETGQPIAPFDNSLTPYKVALQRSGAEALFMVNMLTTAGRLATNADNTTMIQDQVSFLRAAATAGIAVKRVELGNEFYLAGASAGANGNDYTIRFPTAAAYAQQANPWITALRSAFPTVQIAAVGTDATGNNSARREGWNTGVLAGLATGANALTLHPYIQVQSATATPQSLLSMPYARVQSLAATEFPQLASRGLGAWLTEFNMVDRTPNLTFAGTWIHGLFVAAYALLLAQNPTVTLMDLHNVVGDAVAGVLFDSTDGFRSPTPVTQFLGRSAMGSTYATLMQATNASTTAQALAFPTGPVLAGGAPGVVGMDFSGAQHQVVVVNLAPSTVTLNLANLFTGSFNWSRTTAASLSTRITGTSASRSGMAPRRARSMSRNTPSSGSSSDGNRRAAIGICEVVGVKSGSRRSEGICRIGTLRGGRGG